MQGGLRNRGVNRSSRAGKPLFSVITPTLNDAASLRRTIESVLAQTYDNIEYIIIDGGSSDGTMDILAAYEDRIDYWVSEPDAGIFAAMNKGIRLARGELVGIINADDWYVPHAVEEVVRAYGEDPRAGMFYGGMFVIDRLGKVIDEVAGGMKGMFSRNTFNHPACFLPMDTYESFGLYREDIVNVADYELFLRLYFGGAAFHHIDETLAYYSLGGQSDVFRYQTYRDNYRVRRQYGILSDYEYGLLMLFVPLRVAAYKLRELLIYRVLGNRRDHPVIRSYRRLKRYVFRGT